MNMSNICKRATGFCVGLGGSLLGGRIAETQSFTQGALNARQDVAQIANKAIDFAHTYTTNTAIPFSKDIGQSVAEAASKGAEYVQSMYAQTSAEDCVTIGLATAICSYAAYKFATSQTTRETLSRWMPTAVPVALAGVLAYQNSGAIAEVAADVAKEFNPAPTIAASMQWIAEKSSAVAQFVKNQDWDLADLPLPKKELNVAEDILQPLEDNLPQAKTFVTETTIPAVKTLWNTAVSYIPSAPSQPQLRSLFGKATSALLVPARAHSFNAQVAQQLKAYQSA